MFGALCLLESVLATVGLQDSAVAPVQSWAYDDKGIYEIKSKKFKLRVGQSVYHSASAHTKLTLADDDGEFVYSQGTNAVAVLADTPNTLALEVIEGTVTARVWNPPTSALAPKARRRMLKTRSTKTYSEAGRQARTLTSTFCEFTVVKSPTSGVSVSVTIGLTTVNRFENGSWSSNSRRAIWNKWYVTDPEPEIDTQALSRETSTIQ